MDKRQITELEKLLLIALAVTCLGLTYYFIFSEHAIDVRAAINNTQWCIDICKKKVSEIQLSHNGDRLCQCVED